MDILNIIAKKAKSLGACDKADNIKDYRDLVDRMFLNVGAHFCIKHNFPSRAYFDFVKPFVITDERVYIDAGNIELTDATDVCLVGNTNATLTYNGGRCIHKVLCYYGAKATIKAYNKSVVRVFRVDAGEVAKEKDDSSIILNDVTPENAII